tara:strand:- start:13823 stop:15376 length:1554 start_codon:yes stop_codon:yes gene_type:complete
MNPTNSGLAKSKGCNPVSSNCVVWQGPDLDCIGLCKGDSISEVIAKMAKELCTLIEMFDLQEFDFSCLSIARSETPQDFGELFQVLVDRICALEGIDGRNIDIVGNTTLPAGNDCPENCIVPIASCFHYLNTAGDTVTTMSLLDYVSNIGRKICGLLSDVDILQSNVADLQIQINNTTGNVVALETGKADKNSLDYQVSQKTNPSSPTLYITDALREVENSLISTQDCFGSCNDLYQNVIKEGFLTNENKLWGSGKMSSIPGWTNVVQNASQSIGNLWLAIHDIREAVQYVQENTIASTCSSIYLNFRAQLNEGISSKTITVFSDGSTGFNANWVNCEGNSRITVEDVYGNTTTFRASLLSIIDNPAGTTVDISASSIDTTTDLKVTAETCFKNTQVDATCEKDYTYLISASVLCPSTVLTVYSTSVMYAFSSTVGYSYIINIYLHGSSSPVATQILATPSAQIMNLILGLFSETSYDLEVTVVNSKNTETICPRQQFLTLPDNCTPPTSVVAILTT